MKNVFDGIKKLERRIRDWLSRRPVLYAAVGGVGVVLFWRGVWHSADALSAVLFSLPGENSSIDAYSLWDGLLSLVIGSGLLLSTGLFVSDFIGAEVISKDIKGEERLAKKAEHEAETEEDVINKMHHELHGISKRLKRIEKRNGEPKNESR